MPSKEQFFKAVTELFGFVTLDKSHGVKIGVEERQRYGEIGEFLSDDKLVGAALKQVAERMLVLFKTEPERFQHAENSGYVQRNLAGTQVQMDAVESEEQERRNTILSYGTKKLPTKLESMSPLNAKLVSAQNTLRQLGGDLGASNGKAVVRRFSFYKLLTAVEDELLGFDHSGRIVLSTDVKIAAMLRELKVWKDSIGIQHGEYTHRFQWLAIAAGLKYDKPTLATLYKGCSATLQGDVYKYFFAAAKKGGQLPTVNAVGNFNDFVNIHRAENANDRIKDLDLPVNLWEFLFDSLELRGGGNKKCWPEGGPVDKEADPKGIEAYRYSHRSASCRSPAYLNKMLQSAEFGLIFFYLTASSIKTVYTKTTIGTKANSFDETITTERKEGSLSQYRQTRETEKLIIDRFTTPSSTLSPQLVGELSQF